jgi:formate dehydrogenase major subunit
MYPDYQRVGNPEVRERFEHLWGTKLPHKPGLTVVEIMDAGARGRDQGHVHHG